jgi:hypothetical protein
MIWAIPVMSNLAGGPRPATISATSGLTLNRLYS